MDVYHSQHQSCLDCHRGWFLGPSDSSSTWTTLLTDCLFVCEIFIEGFKLLQWPALLSKQTLSYTSRVRLFEDDCLLYTPVDIDTPSEHLQAAPAKIREWQDTWLMTFNPKKCITMTIGMKNPPHHIYNFCGEALESVDSHPYLGVLFNNTMTWGDYVLETCKKKAQRVLGLLRRNCGNVLKKSKQVLTQLWWNQYSNMLALCGTLKTKPMLADWKGFKNRLLDFAPGIQ